MSTKNELTAADGARIAYRAGGEGETMLLVHGAATSGGDWFAVAPALRREFRVIVMDRRGRGRSSDGTEYSMRREAEDLLALIEAEGVEHVVAHSYGALCAMLAVESKADLQRLVLYEPPIAYDGTGLQSIEQLVQQGRYEEVLLDFLTGAGAHPEQLEAIRRSPAWPVLLDTIPVLPRELRAAADWRRPIGPIAIPTRYLVGGDTQAPVYLEGLDELEAAFSDLDRVEIPGERHVAHVFAPDVFAELVLEFCRSA